MFLDIPLPGFCQPSQTACVEVHINRDGSFLYHLLILEKKGTKLQVTSDEKEITLQNDLLKMVRKGMPMVLVLTGKGVIVKKVHHAAAQTEADLIRTLFPDARLTDFVVERLDSSCNNVIFSVARKTLIEQVITPLLTANVSLMDLFLGPLVLSDIITLIETQGNYIQASGFIAGIEDNKIIDFRSTESDSFCQISCGAIQVNSRTLLCFAAGFRHLVINRSKPVSDVDQVRESSGNYRFKLMVTKGIIYYLVSLFLILMINFLVFDQYNSRGKKLMLEVEQHSTVLMQIDSLTRKIHRREAFLRESGLNGQARISFYADRLATSLPDEIKLTELTLFPILFNKDSEKKEPDYIPGVLKVTILVSSSSVLNEWLKSMEQNEWVRSVELTDYKAINDRQAMVKLNVNIRG